MKKHAFTIIELLLVISIAGVMLSVAVPAFSRMIKGSATGIAVRELMGKLNAARAYAIANQTYVAVVFPNTSASGQFKQRYFYRGYRACEVLQTGTNNYAFARWIPGENWQSLPDGVLIGTARSTTPEAFARHGNDDEKKAGADLHSSSIVCEIGGRSFSASGDTIEISNYIIFRPDGMLDTMPEGALLRLRTGKVDSSGSPITNSLSGEYIPLVIRFNGKVKAYNELVAD